MGLIGATGRLCVRELHIVNGLKRVPQPAAMHDKHAAEHTTELKRTSSSADL